jgi:hypothetical protein
MVAGSIPIALTREGQRVKTKLRKFPAPRGWPITNGWVASAPLAVKFSSGPQIFPAVVHCTRSAYGPGKSAPGAGVKLPVEKGVTQFQASPPMVPEVGASNANVIGFPPPTARTRTNRLRKNSRPAPERRRNRGRPSCRRSPSRSRTGVGHFIPAQVEGPALGRSPGVTGWQKISIRELISQPRR